MTEYPKWIGYVYVGTKGRQVPLSKVKIVHAEQDYTGHEWIVTFIYKRVQQTSLMIKKLK